MKTNNQLKLATATIKILTEKNHIAYLAGGCVRDDLLGIEPNDYDVATNATPDQIMSYFDCGGSVGKIFGVVIVKGENTHIEVATFRNDGVYIDGRHPSNIQYTDDKTDALRRDFTINGLFKDVVSGGIIDYVGGVDDIKHKIIRAIGNPCARFKDDHLRLLRAIRFSTRLNFSLDYDTSVAIKKNSKLLKDVSRERISQEFLKMLSCGNFVYAIKLLEDHNLDETVLNTKHQRSTLSVSYNLPTNASNMTKLCAWLFDRDDNETIHETCSKLLLEYNHYKESLCLTNNMMAQFNSVLTTCRKLSTWRTLSMAKKRRIISSNKFKESLELFNASNRKYNLNHTESKIIKDVNTLRNHFNEMTPKPFIDGKHLIDRGFQPCIRFKQLLEYFYDEQLNNNIKSKDDAMVRLSLESGRG